MRLVISILLGIFAIVGISLIFALLLLGVAKLVEHANGDTMQKAVDSYVEACSKVGGVAVWNGKTLECLK